METSTVLKDSKEANTSLYADKAQSTRFSQFQWTKNSTTLEQNHRYAEQLTGIQKDELRAGGKTQTR